MPLIKFVIDKNFANKHYLVAGNRLRLGDVDTDAVAEKLYNAKVKGVSLVEEASTVPVIETVVTDPQPALLAEAPATTAKKK